MREAQDHRERLELPEEPVTPADRVSCFEKTTIAVLFISSVV